MGVGSKIWWSADQVGQEASETASTNGHRGRCHFHEVFSQAGSTNLIKLLPWCFSSTVPLHYTSEALATTAQQEEDIPATIAVPKLECSQALGPSDSPAYVTGTLPLPVPPLPDISFVGISPIGHPFAHFMPAPHRKGRTTLPVAHLAIIMTRGPVLTPKRLRLGVKTALHRARRTHPHWHQRLGPALIHKGRNLPVPLPVQPRPSLILMMVQWGKPWGVLGIRTVRAVPTTVRLHLTRMHLERMWPTLIWSQPPRIVSLAQIQMRKLSELPTGSTVRGYKLPVA